MVEASLRKGSGVAKVEVQNLPRCRGRSSSKTNPIELPTTATPGEAILAAVVASRLRLMMAQRTQ